MPQNSQYASLSPERLRIEVAQQSFNPYLDEINRMWKELIKQFPKLQAGGIRGWWAWVRSSVARRQCLDQRVPLDEKYSYAIPNVQAINKLASLGKLIEIGAGTGYWGSLLKKKGCNILLFDIAPPSKRYNDWHGNQKQWADVRQGDAKEVKNHPDRTLFMCWPPYDMPMASKALSYYKGNTLAYVGHCASGQTGDPEFHLSLNEDWVIQETVVIPSWRDFFLAEHINRVSPGSSWEQASAVCDDFRDKLFIFARKDNRTIL